MTDRQRSLRVHVGHGKTGSSYLQSALAASRGVLTQAGIDYPIAEDRAELARKGAITSGNLRYVPGALAGLLQGAAADHVLISSESLFPALARQLASFCAEAEAAMPGVALEVLLYIRDPLDHAVSSYHQEVKRGGYTGSLSDVLADYMMPAKVGQFLRQVRDSGAVVTVRNYSRHSKALLPTLEEWIGLPPGALVPPPLEQINRSLTLAEIALQKAFNAHFGKAARRFVSDPLCAGLPDLQSETPPVPEVELAQFLDRMQAMIATKIDAGAIPQTEAYRVGTVAEHLARFSAPHDPDRLVFSRAQLSVFVEALHAELARSGTVRRKLDRQRRPVAGGDA